MTKGELFEILKRYPNDSEIFVDLGLTRVEPIIRVLWSPPIIPRPTRIYLRIKE